jgi:sugar lactone lactonase YvrE
VDEIPASCISGANNASCVTALGGGFNSPFGVAVDGAGNVYVADSSNSAVKEVPSGCTSSSCVTTLGGGFGSPEGVAVDAKNNVYVADIYQSVVSEIMRGSVNFKSIPVGSTSPALTLNFTFDTSGSIDAPAVLTQGAKNLDFADAGTGTCDTNGTSHVYSAGDTCTVDVTFTPKYPGLREGAVELTASGTPIATAYVYGTGTGPQAAFSPSSIRTLGGGFQFPTDTAVDASGNVYVADYNVGTVNEIPSGCTSSSCVVGLGGGFSLPIGMAVDGAGNVYVADYGHNLVKEMPSGCTSSSCVTTLGGGFSAPTGVAVDGAGNVYITDEYSSAINEMPPGCPSSSCVKTLGGGFSNPFGVAVDASGNVYVADTNSVVKEIPASCINGANSASCVKTLGGGFTRPYDVAVDSAGNVYVTDGGSSSVKEIPAGCTSASCVSSLGSGFGLPVGVALDGAGNLYIGGGSNASVEEIERATPPSLSFANTNVGSTSADSPQTVTVQNVGNGTLTFPIPATAGAYNPSVSSNFSYDNSSTCLQNGSGAATAFTLASAGSCTVAIDFAPATVGSISGDAVLTDDSLNAAAPNFTTQSIAVSGTGIAAVTQLAFSTAPPTTLTAGGNAGTVIVAEQNASGTTVASAADSITLTVTGPNSYSKTYTQTAASGVASFNLSSVTLQTAGNYSYTATSGTYTQATASETVSAAAVSAISVVSGSGQSAAIGAAFTSPLVVKVLDSYGNPVSGATVVFTPPSSGASAALSTAAATGANGETSTTATANGTASATAYDVSASVSGASSPALFALTNKQASTTLTVTPSATALAYGQPVTISASIAPASAGGSTPTGSVTFYDGATALSPNATVANAAASDAIQVPAVGSHSYAAKYLGDTNFAASTQTVATSTVQVSKASSTLAGPASAATVSYGTGGSIAVTIAGQFAGAGIATPTGSIGYAINGTSISGTGTITNGAATIPVPSTLAAGNYTVAVTYGGDSNYNAATSLSVPLTVTKAVLTVVADNATRVYGTANPTFTGSVTGAINGDSFTESFTTAATTTSPVGQYAIVPSVTGTNLSDYSVAPQNGTLTITQAASSVVLTSSTANSNLNAALTFTATVTSTVTGMPSGSVEFLDGSTVLGSTTLDNSGVATYTTSSLTAGLHSITAIYSGDTNFSGSTSSALAQIVTAPAFSLSSSTTNLSLKAGQTGKATISMIPVGGYQGTAQFTCSGLPANSRCAFSPSLLTADGSNTTLNSTLTITTVGPNSGTVAVMTTPPGGTDGAMLAGIFWLPGLLFGGFLMWQRKRLTARYQVLVLVLLVVTTMSGMIGCGFSQPMTGPGVSTVTVTATSGSSTHTVTLYVKISQ